MLRVILGRRGTGKTTLAIYLAQPSPRLLAVDTLSSATDGDLPLTGMVVVGPAWLTAVASLRPPMDRFRIVFQELPEADLEPLCALALDVGDLHLWIDEVDWWMTQLGMPDSFKAVVRYGRHYGIDLTMVARRPADVPRLVTSQADVIVSFGMTEPRDLDWLRDAVGDDARRVRDLPEHTFARFDIVKNRTAYGRLDLTSKGPRATIEPVSVEPFEGE